MGREGKGEKVGEVGRGGDGLGISEAEWEEVEGGEGDGDIYEV